jgi:hypothetical protein
MEQIGEVNKKKSFYNKERYEKNKEDIKKII